MNPLIVVWSLGFLLLPISVYLVEALSAYNSFKVWRAGRVAGV
jgi:hypothetical protein